MKPVIVHPPGKPEMACLIDLHATAYVKNVQGIQLPPGKVAPLQLKAVALNRLRVGEFSNIEGTEYPAPAQVCITTVWEIKAPMHRGIFPDAAVALLTMDHGLKNAVSPGVNFEMAQDTTGFNKWQFAIAWTWSAWQAKHRQGDPWPLKRRWEDMKTNLGYPDTEIAFRQICSRLGLSVTRSRPVL